LMLPTLPGAQSAHFNQDLACSSQLDTKRILNPSQHFSNKILVKYC